jgi:hypothetical protein
VENLKKNNPPMGEKSPNLVTLLVVTMPASKHCFSLQIAIRPVGIDTKLGSKFFCMKQI